MSKPKRPPRKNARRVDVLQTCRECGTEEAPHGTFMAREGRNGERKRLRVRPCCQRCWAEKANPKVRERERLIADEKRRKKKPQRKQKRTPGAPRAIGDPRVAPARVVFVPTPESEGRRLAREKEERRAWLAFVGSHRWYKRGGAGRRKGREAS